MITTNLCKLTGKTSLQKLDQKTNLLQEHDTDTKKAKLIYSRH